MSLEDMTDDARDELALLADKLANDPATRKDFLKLAKRANPNLPIPEIDMQDAMSLETKGLRDEIAAMKDKEQERAIRDSILSRRNDLIKNGLASEAEIPEIEKLMTDRKIADHTTAAEFFKLQKESARPTPSMYTPNTLPVDVKKIGGNITQWARKEAGIALDEINRSKRA